MDDNKKFLDSFNKALGMTALVSFRIYKNDADGGEIWCIEKIDWDRVTELTGQPYVSLAEAVLIITERVSPCNPTLKQMPLIFMTAIREGALDPREPSTLLPLSKLNHLDHVLLGWSWLLNLGEVGEFAIRKGWPEELFSDLINIESPVIEIDSLETTAPVNKRLIDPKLLKSEKQVKAILEAISDLGFEPMAVPDGGQRQLEELCRGKYSTLFDKDSSFTNAWKKARKMKEVKMANHEGFARRGK